MSIKEMMTTSSKVERKDTEEYCNKLLNKYNVLKNFLLIKRNELLNKAEKNDLKDMFQQLNEIIFAGFDYYYVNDFKELFKSKEDLKANFNLLINKDHVDKLKTTIDCFDNLEFINYKDNNYIWYKNTNVRANLILFERTDNNEIIINKDDNKIKISNDVVKIIDRKRNKQYNNLEYKLFR